MQRHNATHDGSNDGELCADCAADRPAHYRVETTGDAVCKAHALAYWSGREDGISHELTALRVE